MYIDYEMVEFFVKNLNTEKSIFVYDPNFVHEFERNVKVAWSEQISKYKIYHATGFFLGRGPNGSDRFVVVLGSVMRNQSHKPIDVYVKMGSSQVQTLKVQTGY